MFPGAGGQSKTILDRAQRAFNVATVRKGFADQAVNIPEQDPGLA
jgi:hypothetical protein